MLSQGAMLSQFILEGLIELLSKAQNKVWDFFEKLAWETYAFEQANIPNSWRV